MQIANAAIRDRISAPLGYGKDDSATTRVAHGILDLANTLMAGAVKEITVARGHDVREFVLLVFGGGGPIFGAELAKSLGIRRVVVPPEPGNFSALGMLMANARIDMAQSLIVDLSDQGIETLRSVRDKLRTEAITAAEREFSGKSLSLRWLADMRYRGQRHSIPVKFEADPDAAVLLRAFEIEYATRFGRTLGEDFAPEVVGLRVAVESASDRPDLSTLMPRSSSSRSPAPIDRRPLHLRPGGWIEAPVWKREMLPVGFVIAGPAIVEEYGSTTLIGAGDVATIGRFGEIDIAVSSEGAAQ
jgi:N-methylhydantoinase A